MKGIRPYARRLESIEPFRVVEVLTRARELEREGRDIIHLGAGEPDFATAPPIIEAGRASLARGETYYTEAGGIPQLREAVSTYYQSQYRLTIDPRRIMITPGASGALLLLSALLINPGEGMLMTDPGYPCNRQFLQLVGGEGQLVSVSGEQNYQLTPELIASHWSHNTVGALVASPANPTGAVLDREALANLATAVARRQGFLVVDEIYHGLSFGVNTPSVLEVDDNAFVINSFSKYFGMTGWRLGWLVAPESAIPGLEKLAQNLFISMSTMAQHAALAGFDPATRRILDQRRDVFAARRDYLYPALKSLGFGLGAAPEGAFYIYADITRFSDDSQQFCSSMLESHGIALTPGADFGRYRASEHVRFSYTTGMERIEEAVGRMRKVLN